MSNRLQCQRPPHNELPAQQNRKCPVCQQLVRVGGPHPDHSSTTWVILNHGPDPGTLCTGTGSHVRD